MERVPFTLYYTKKRLEELRALSKKLDMPVSILVRMGSDVIIQRYKKVLIEKE